MILDSMHHDEVERKWSRGKSGIIHHLPRKLSPPKISKCHPFQKNNLLDSPNTSEPARVPKFCSFGSSQRQHCSFDHSPTYEANPFLQERQSQSFSYNSNVKLPRRIKRVHSFSGDLEDIIKGRAKAKPSLNQSMISIHSVEVPEHLSVGRLHSAK